MIIYSQYEVPYYALKLSFGRKKAPRINLSLHLSRIAMGCRES